MPTLATRFPTNPLLTPAQVKPSRPDWEVECVLNPGAFRYGRRTGLLLRVAERPPQEAGWISTPVLDPAAPDGVRIVRYRTSDPKLKATDPRLFEYDGLLYLTTLSHLRLAWSDDGVHFAADAKPTLIGRGRHETFGIEDSRVTQIGTEYYLTYTVVSECGVAVGASRTTDWKTFEPLGVLIPPHNKDFALFDQKIGGHYYAFHRPTGVGLGGNYLWLGSSPDLRHWGDHRCVALTRPGHWDCERIGAGAAPIRTEAGWLEIYHAADSKGIYRLGLMLLALDNPSKVLARSVEPIMEPAADYEKKGFLGGVVFTNGHIVEGDKVTIYYGAADTVVCGASFSIAELLRTLPT
ncbi:MAG: glycoside hydrolase family 130 protein [Phycisphaerae bacterium]